MACALALANMEGTPDRAEKADKDGTSGQTMAEPHPACTVGDLSRLTFTKPQEITLAIYRVLCSAQAYIKSESSILKTEHDIFVTSYQELRSIFDGLLEAVDAMPVHCSDDNQEDNTTDF